ncbi:E3 ubiquitin-protein ligase [Melia azedarach]|uniref:E3 ubiquitin-protein ligase n=1 Tax=Melia azedarach TaxID=155640 RepID=A0ACC1X757_MELAZ|nr:E3 ubiquitin-protein ligase [Melia azedarach]
MPELQVSQFTFCTTAIEEVLELLRRKCKNAENGCQETVGYSRNDDHEKTCRHAPYSCPLSDCNFVGSTSQLYLAFGAEHRKPAVDFKYNVQLNVNLNVNEKFLFFRDEISGHLFIINNRITRELGNIVSISSIGASQEKELTHQIGVRNRETNLRDKYTRRLRNGFDDDHFTADYVFLVSQLLVWL